MNDWDKNNLNFIMSLNSADFDEWYESLSQDDLDYAMELLKQARTEVSVQVAALFDEPETLKDARKVLAKYTLSKKVTVK